MKRPGQRALLAPLVSICVLAMSAGAVEAGALFERERHRPAGRTARVGQRPLRSPDGRHRAELTSTGRLEVDGLPVIGARPLIGRPVWRGDSRALAFLQRGREGVQLAVLLIDVDPIRPLIWSLPPTVDGLRLVFWISRQRVGVGEKALVPRVVVSWTSTVA